MTENLKLAVVTGGSRGIGRAIAELLARTGHRVCLTYNRNLNAANEVLAGIENKGGSAFAEQCDVGDAKAVANLFNKLQTDFGGVDVLVNNAGVAINGLIMTFSEEKLATIINTNLNGVFYCSKAASSQMMKKRAGKIVTITSVAGLMGNAGQTAYSASKAGVIGLTKALAKELGKRGITVNAVAPGLIETDMTEDIQGKQREGYLAQIPLGRSGKPEDVAEIVGFLCSKGANYITGQVISVNGGMYM